MIYYRLIKRDIQKSRLETSVTMVFIAAATMLLSLAAILAVNLWGSIDTLMNQAKTPHFMQMHTGDINWDRLGLFARNSPYTEGFQVVEFLNLAGSEITIGEQSFADSVQDLGITVQSKDFDFLLDLSGNVIKPSDGQLYVPAYCLQEGYARIGDRAVIGGREFTVAGVLRDSQMNSLLASSKRFLVSDHDYQALRSQGDLEYLIEFRLKNLAQLHEFEQSYTQAGLEDNGPVITYPLFKLLNAVSDGIMIAEILLISLLVVAVAFLCIRFVLLGKIEEDYREIGVMKAIGLRVSDIKMVYMAKYIAVAGAGSILGLILAFIFKEKLMENIRLNLGVSNQEGIAFFLAIGSAVLIFTIVTGYVGRVLSRFKKISPSDALHFNAGQETFGMGKVLRLNRNRLLNTSVFLGLKDVISRGRLYGTMLLVLIIAIFITIIPQNLYSTVSSDDFMKYMGIGSSHIRIDMTRSEGSVEKSEEIQNLIEEDPEVSQTVLLNTGSFQVIGENGIIERLNVEMGDHLKFPVLYSEGKAPEGEYEIALSGMNAEELNKKIGDSLIMMVNGEERVLTVCGIYSDITNGGKTAKAAFHAAEYNPMWSIIYIELRNQQLKEMKAQEYGDSFPFAKVTDTEQYVKQTFQPTRDSIKKAAVVSAVVSLIIGIMVTLLFMKMLIAKDRYTIAAMKALGFRTDDIKLQYMSGFMAVLLTAVVIGTAMANTLGGKMAGIFIAQLGASAFHFTINPYAVYLYCPLIMICILIVVVNIGTRSVGNIRISDSIKE